MNAPEVDVSPHLLRTASVERPALLLAVLTDHPDAPTSQPREPHDDTLAPGPSDLKPTSLIHDELNHAPNIVRPDPLARDDAEELFGRAGRRVGDGKGGREEGDGGREVG